MITVLAGNGSEGGNNGLELGIGIVTGSDGNCGSFPVRLIGRSFGFSFDFRAGVVTRSSSVMSMTSSEYCGGRFVDLRVRILARSAMSGEKLFNSGPLIPFSPLTTAGSEWVTAVC